MNTQLNALTAWVQTTRQQNLWLDNEADMLLARLQQWQLARYYANVALEAEPALVIQSLTAEPFSPKLVELLGNEQQRIKVFLDSATLDYVSHILPCLSETSLAVRFTDKPQVSHGPYVLTLTLMRASDKARRLVSLHAATINEDDFSQCLTLLEHRKLPSSSGIIDTLEFLSVVDVWRQSTALQAYLSPTQLLQASEIAPFLSQDDLTTLMAYFWNNMPTATAQWRHHLQIQKQFSYARQVIAPARTVITSYVISHLSSYQTGGEPSLAQTEEIPVCPMITGAPLPAVSIQRKALFEACREITIVTNSADSRLSAHDIVVIPDSLSCRFDLPFSLGDESALLQQQERSFDSLRTHLNCFLHNQALEKKEAESLLKILQSRSDRHGELLDGLAIQEQQLNKLADSSLSASEPSVLPFAINLLDEAPEDQAFNREDNFAARAYRCWINHIRDKGFDAALANRCGITLADLQQLCQIMIWTSYETNLQQYLATALVDFSGNADASICCATRILNEFITWLGYDCMPSEDRPLSKINQGTTLFTPPKDIMRDAALPHLDTVMNSNITWLGDWLIALLNRAQVVPEHYGLTDEQKHQLEDILH